MREVKIKGADGREVVRLLPENADDVERLRELAKKGEVSDDEALNDPPPR